MPGGQPCEPSGDLVGTCSISSPGQGFSIPCCQLCSQQRAELCTVPLAAPGSGSQPAMVMEPGRDGARLPRRGLPGTARLPWDAQRSRPLLLWENRDVRPAMEAPACSLGTLNFCQWPLFPAMTKFTFPYLLCLSRPRVSFHFSDSADLSAGLCRALTEGPCSGEHLCRWI